MTRSSVLVRLAMLLGVIGACLLVIGVACLFLSYDGTSRVVHAVSVSCGSVASPTRTDPGSHIDCDRAGHLATAVKLMGGGFLLIAAMAYFRRPARANA